MTNSFGAGATEDRGRQTGLESIRRELMAPAGTIVGYAELLREQSASDGLEEMTLDLDRVLQAARDLHDLVYRLLDGDAARVLFQGEDPQGAQQKMRHDLRTPINGIKGYGEMLLEDLENLGGEHLRGDLEKLLEEGSQLLSRLDRIVNFTSLEPDRSQASETASSQMVSDLLKSIKPVESEALEPVETGYILIVDDFASNRDLLSRRLLRDGHRIAVAEDGVSALEMLRADVFDLVLLDLMMPDMNGFEVLAAMKTDDELKAVPVIMVSALDETDTVIRCIEAGADDYLPKPINATLLRARIKSGLEKKAWQDDERQQKKFIRQAFSRYLSREVVDQLVADPKRFSLGGERLDITCLFTDLAGFTSLMEDRDPGEMVPVLNAYLDAMCMIARNYGGTIDKIAGDALHVFFGAPLRISDHAERVMLCAIDMDVRAREFQRTEAARAIGFGGTRIGVHSGPAVVGNFGGEVFFDYTAYGDSVNTAARLQGANAHLGTRLCVSGETARQCPSIRFRPIGSLVLKGKTQAVETFEPVLPEMETPLDEYLRVYQSIESGDPGGIAALVALSAIYPLDPILRLYVKRAEASEPGVEMILAEK